MAVLVALVGCGDSQRGAVSGRITLDGQPVDGGTVNFIPTSDSEGSAVWGEIKGGLYSLSGGNGSTVGQNRVEIRWPKKTGRRIPMAAPAPPDAMIEQTIEAIPARYNTQSELHVEVQQGENTFNFELVSK